MTGQYLHVLHCRQAPSFSRGNYPRSLGRASLCGKARGTARQAARPFLMCAPCCQGAAPLGAPSRRSHYGAGPRFRETVSPCLRPGFRGAFRVTAPSRPRAGLNGPPSASSSQGAVVPPGGAPAPPECAACEAAPAGAGPNPTNGATGSRPLRGSGEVEYSPSQKRNQVLFYVSWPGSSRPSTAFLLNSAKAWMPGTTPGMTKKGVSGSMRRSRRASRSRTRAGRHRPRRRARDSAGRCVPTRSGRLS